MTILIGENPSNYKDKHVGAVCCDLEPPLPPSPSFSALSKLSLNLSCFCIY